MLTLQRILCPTDFTDGSRYALLHAIGLARTFHAGITAVHVAETIPPYGVDSLDGVTREKLDRELRRYIDPAVACKIPSESILEEGAPAEAIMRQARRISADLIVMGTHGRGGFERFAMGSVAEKVVRKSPCPVLTVSRKVEKPAAAGGPPFRTILCPIEFSEPSLRAEAACFALAEGTGARVILLHVVEILPEWESRGLAHFNVPEFARYLEHAALERLRESVPKESGGKPGPATMVARGRAWREILRVAEEQSADLIVMGTQGHGALDLLVVGSTVAHVMRAAPCPVLTIGRNQREWI